jgi:hypothetical protein
MLNTKKLVFTNNFLSLLLTTHQRRLIYVVADEGSLATTLVLLLMRREEIKIKNKKENARGSPYNVLLAFSHTYVKHDLRRKKIVMASTTRFFRH